MKHVNRDCFMLSGTACLCVTALEGLNTTTRSARNFHDFLQLMTKQVTGNKGVTKILK